MNLEQRAARRPRERPARRAPRGARPLLLVTLLLFSGFSSVAGVVDVAGGQGTRPFQEETVTLESRSVTVPAPAVGETQAGALVGVTSTLEVTIRNGTGAVFVDTRPFAQLDMQGSARLAAATAAGLTGRDFEAHDYFVAMRADSPVVGGPSAGGIMTVAFVALLLDAPLRNDVAMTGMINPDGTIGPVGGILEKAQAVAEMGVGLFLVPEGQSVVTRVGASGRAEAVDVREVAAQRWGLEVREVLDVQEAVEAFTDIVFDRPEPGSPEASAAVNRILEDAAVERESAARQELQRLREALDPAPENLSSNLRADLEETLASAEATLERAAAANEEGAPYTAASLIFQARIALRQVDLVLQASQAADEMTFLHAYADAVQAEAQALADLLDDASPTTVSELEGIGAAQVRVVEAVALVADARQALDTGRGTDAVAALAFARERVGSVGEWQELAAAFEEVDESATITADPSALATEVHAAAQQSYAYALSLIGQTTPDPQTASFLAEARRALEEAAQALALGLDLAGMYLALDGQTAAHAALSLVGAPSLLDDRVARQAERAGREISTVRELGGEPVLALSLFEFADSLRGEDAYNALLLFGSSATVARLSALLAGASGCAFGGLACVSGAEPRLRNTYDITDPWTGYFALAALLLGFLSGALVAMVAQRGGAPPAATLPSTATVQARGGGVMSTRTNLRSRNASMPPIRTSTARDGFGAGSARRRGRPALVHGLVRRTR